MHWFCGCKSGVDTTSDLRDAAAEATQDAHSNSMSPEALKAKLQNFNARVASETDTRTYEALAYRDKTYRKSHSAPGHMLPMKGNVEEQEETPRRLESDSDVVEMPCKRKVQKAMTMPARIEARRSSITLSMEVLTKLLRQHDERRADALSLLGAQTEFIAEADLEACWTETATCHVHGIAKGKQRDAGAELKYKFSDNRKKLPGEPPAFVSCQKGKKGNSPSPNQDNFSLTYFKNGYTLACVFDGHGQWGHLVSLRTVQTVPYFLIRSKHFETSIEKALVEAFEKAHDDCVAIALQQDWNIMASGSTAVAALWKGNKLWTANSGDSRCVVSSIPEAAITHETVDHKPDDEKEKARVVAAGGRVKSETYDDGLTLHRIFIGEQNYPGLSMTRSLGDVCVKDHGVIPTPDICSIELDLSKKPFILLGSDGIWEFMSSETAVNHVIKAYAVHGAGEAIADLHDRARELWANEEDNYCDDMTSMLVLLQNPADTAPTQKDINEKSSIPRQATV